MYVRVHFSRDYETLISSNATVLGSRIPPDTVLLKVNHNTPVKLKFILFKNGVHLRIDSRTKIIYI